MYGYLSEANRDLPPGIPESVWLPGHRKLGLQSKIVRICSGDMNWDSARVSIRRNFGNPLTYAFAEPKEQISGLTNQYLPKPPSGET